MPPRSTWAHRLLRAAISVPFKLACIALMILIPLIGVWVSSSLAVFANRSILLPVGAGLLMFPVLPLLWEAFAGWRRKRRGKSGDKRILNLLDRMILRTVTLNALLIGVLLYAYPQQAFTALSTRGDWMLAGSEGPRVEQVRGLLFRAADTLEWIYKRSKKNPYEKYDDGSARKKKPAPRPKKKPDTGNRQDREQRQDREAHQQKEHQQKEQQQETETEEQEDRQQAPSRAYRSWPQPATLHPIVARIPAEAQSGPGSVGRYIRAQLSDPFDRARAVHDYVAHRVDYDVPAYRSGDIPDQSAERIFRERRGVCAGYATLFDAIGEAAGLETVYLVGHGRTKTGGVDGVGHAWNAVKLEDRWYLVDVTWDAGHVNGAKFTRKLKTDYFLTPPEVFGSNHFPDDPRWQLRDRPLTRGEFIRQPMMRPAFFANHLRLASPRRSQVTVQGAVEIRIENPKGRFLLAEYRSTSASEKPGPRCKVTRGGRTTIRCDFRRPGSFNVELFVSPTRYATYSWVGTVNVNNEG